MCVAPSTLDVIVLHAHWKIVAWKRWTLAPRVRHFQRLTGMIPHFRSSNSLKSNLGCRLVQMTLALYLLPAILIVLVVGAAGILVTGVIRFFTLVLGTTAEGGGIMAAEKT